MKPGDHKLTCTGCGAEYAPPQLHCDACDGLLRSTYASTAFEPKGFPGLSSFLDWLPIASPANSSTGAAVYASEGLGPKLGLSRLSIAFSGYAPVVGAANPTGSFKDFEAAVTIPYCREHGMQSLILASAGNTARAFACAAVRHRFPIVIVIPERAIDGLWIPCEPTDAIRLVVLDGCDDYAAAIRSAALIGEALSIPNEGGARNVARRDGMSTAILEYARRMNSLPGHYFQAIGSGTGAIATWEASQRLLAAGIGERLPRLHLCQNAPFAPIHDAWTHGIPIEPDQDVEGQLRRIEQIDALVLANRTPPYSTPGGVRDALNSTDGFTYATTNEEARRGAALFEKAEGLPIGSAAAVAVASLIQAIDAGRIGADDEVMLHITGNDELLLKHDATLHPVEPVWRVRIDNLSEQSILAARDRLCTPCRTP